VQCDGGTCVEIATQGEYVLIRSTADQDRPPVTLTRDEWQAFVGGVKDGDFDNI
jgi:uncharacterized protein DUF397